MDRLHRHYLRWLLATVLVASALVAGIVLLVDPYGLYALVDRPGFNHVKPPLTRHQFEIKLARVERLRPALLIVGNSRVEAGLDPDGAQLADAQAFNLGLAGTGTPTAVGQLRHMVKTGSAPQRVIAGLDFVDALTERPVVNVAAVPLSVPTMGQEWRFDALFSFASLKDAVRTVAIQRDPEAAVASLRGFNPLQQYRQTARVEGYAAIFRQRSEENARKALTREHGGLDGPAVRAEVAALLDAAAAGNPGVAVDLVIYPYHAQLMALFEATHLMPRFDAWKAILVAEAQAARLRHPGARIVLHDFSGYGPFQCEPIPAQGGVTQWYWEGGHFKGALGEVMLARMLGQPTVVDDFGMVLTAPTLEENRRRIAAERADCVARQAPLFDDVARTVARLRGRAAAVSRTAP